MTADVDSTPPQPRRDSQAELVAFLCDRSAPCPRCHYDLRDIKTSKCPECGEALVLKVGAAQARFGWLVLAMAPGCFSGVAAIFVMIPIAGMIWERSPLNQGVPWQLMAADAFGLLSAASVGLMYRHRHRFMCLKVRRQIKFVGTVWGIHFLALGLLILSAWLWS